MLIELFLYQFKT